MWNSNSISTTFHSGTLAFNYKAFVPVAQVLVESPVVAVKSDAKWKTLKDLIADGKARPKAITIGNSGVGSHTHISSVALFRPAGVEAVDVPFAAAQVVPSLLGGQVDAVVQLPAALAQYVKSGQVRFLAAMIASRDPAFPDVPTAREQGFDVTLEAWRGIAVPEGHAGRNRRRTRSRDPQHGRERGIQVRPASASARVPRSCRRISSAR